MEREGTGLGSRRPQLFPLLSVIRVETLPLTVPQELTWVSETPCREDNIQYQGQVGGGLGLSPSQEVGHGGWGQRLALLSSLPPPTAAGCGHAWAWRVRHAGRWAADSSLARPLGKDVPLGSLRASWPVAHSPCPPTPYPKGSPSKAELGRLRALLCWTYSLGLRPLCSRPSHPFPLFLRSASPRTPSRVLCCPLTPTALSEDPAPISDSG